MIAGDAARQGIDVADLLEKLAAWTFEGASFHGDRQLADEVLLACGWNCRPNADFEDGVEWWCGVNPRCSMTERKRSHPLHSLNDAFAHVASDWRIVGMMFSPPDERDEWTVTAQRIKRRDVWIMPGVDNLTARHRVLELAICLIAVKSFRSPL